MDEARTRKLAELWETRRRIRELQRARKANMKTSMFLSLFSLQFGFGLFWYALEVVGFWWAWLYMMFWPVWLGYRIAELLQLGAS